MGISHVRRVLALSLALAISAAAQAPALSDQEKETFLQTAEVVKSKRVSTGITGTRRVTLSDGELTHDASVQTVDISKTIYETANGVELNFRDCYRYNIAAYRLDRLVELQMVPVSIKRKIGGESAAFTWWVDDVMMMEKERFLKKIQPPNVEGWNELIYQARVFNELIYNTDPNLGNFLILQDWRLRLIDFTRAFRLRKSLRAPKNLKDARIDRRFLEGLRALDAASLGRELGEILTKSELAAILPRRDKILEYFDDEVRRLGEGAVIVDVPRR